MRFPLVPRRRELGWTPYAWLIYLGGFVAYPAFGWVRGASLGWALATLPVFLALYFWAYWLPGKRVLLACAGIALLGLLHGPSNPGASVFFIYAAAFLGHAGSASFALRCLLAVAALPALEAWLLGLTPVFWVPGVVFSLLVGGINIHQAGVTRANARLRQSQEEVERLAKRAERERIARDLHDLLGHTLTVVALKAELASKLARRDPERASREMEQVVEVARQALAEVRGAVETYRLTRLATELTQARLALETAGIVCESRVEEIPPLPPQREQVLALALREAVTNVVRHSGADLCRIRVRDLGSEVDLEVRDNGRGGSGAPGAGLTGMAERVEALGGRVEREQGRGTRLRVTLPRPEDADETAATPVEEAS